MEKKWLIKRNLHKLRVLVHVFFTGRFNDFYALVRQLFKPKRKHMRPGAIDLSMLTILATQHTSYVAHFLEQHLNSMGFRTRIEYTFNPKSDLGQLYFAICPQMFKKLPWNYVAFQMEQSVSSRWFTERYFFQLKEAIAICDYSKKNIEFLLNKGIPYQQIYYLPIGSVSCYKNDLDGREYSNPEEQESCEVLFYGDTSSKRRQRFLEKLQSRFKVRIVQNIFGEEMVAQLCSAKIVINIHYYENALLETTRIHEVLSLGVPIISESSQDIGDYPLLADVIEVVPEGDIDQMADRIEELLKNSAKYDSLKQQIRNYNCCFSESSAFYFDRLLLAHDWISYEQFLKNHPVNFEKNKELCLSLTETPSRKRHFQMQKRNQFKIIEGLRHFKGWIGCGLSYKYMLQGFTKADLSRFPMICEDDVVFFSDFNEKVKKIRNYLESLEPNSWQIFSGLIAWLDPDTEILKVEKVDGVEYIYINKMTSTVCNIYNEKSAEFIAQWNESNRNQRTNTIDKYIESLENLVVITTLPFLVSHSSEEDSSIWKMNNSNYDMIIVESAQLLDSKIKSYKKMNNINFSD
ncbi:MAG: hypothetical protein KBF19_00520 [Negativicutes bacterium]|nr:hypothetical protein [Negativicutes bacterium]